MMEQHQKIYLEVGSKRTFAGAIAWPGWCRSGRNEAAALQALLDYGPRYAGVLHAAGVAFEPPVRLEAFVVVERLPGNTTTDFGAPDIAPASDSQPLDEAELERLQAILRACWHALDGAVAAAAGKTLRLGPRGGGRNVAGIVAHVRASETGYARQLGLRHKGEPQTDDENAAQRQAILAGLAAAARGELPTVGPRGGGFWTPRYFVRRVAWHILDHGWEIEDRIVE